ncbi:TPA: hypothetical protein ACG0QJ_002912 [Proteus mirabilis]
MKLSVIKKECYFFLSIVCLTSLSFSVQATMDLSVPIGATGYLGEVPAPVTSATIDGDRFVFHSSELPRNQPIIGFAGNTATYVTGELTYYPTLGRPGIPMYNNTTNNKKAFIVLVPSGSFVMNYRKFDGSFATVSAVVNRGKVTSMNGLYNDGLVSSIGYKYNELNWGIFPKSGQSNFFYLKGNKYSNLQATISGYSVYAIGSLEPGSYSLAKEHSFYVSVSLSSGSGTTTRPNFLDSSTKITVNALKACDVTPQTATSINYRSQIAQKFSTPTKLDENIASINVDCPYAGNVHITLRPFNTLIKGSDTGMELMGTKAQESGNALPYVVTSLTSQQQNTICEPNSSDALSYVGSNKLVNAMPKVFNQTLYFNLCANGNIPADRYSGSVDVAILVE